MSKCNLARFCVIREPDGFYVERLSKTYRSMGLVGDIEQLKGPFETEKEAAQAVYGFVFEIDELQARKIREVLSQVRHLERAFRALGA
jgi:hypothetical protein